MPRKPAKKSKRISNKRKKGFSWKTLVKSGKTRKRFKRGASLALLVFMSLAFLGGIWGYNAITKPFASADSSTAFDINNSDIVSLAVISVGDIAAAPVKATSIHFIIMDKANGEILSYEIDPAVTTNAPGKFGEEPYSNLISLGMIGSDNLTDGANLLVSALEKDFAFNADRYLVVENSLIEPVLSTFTRGTGNALLNLETLQNLAFSTNTNITTSEFFNLFTFVRSLSKESFANFKITVSDNLFEDEEYLDPILREITFSSKVAEEKASVGILNGTNIPGVASFASRVVRNTGGHVIAAENALQKYDQSVLYVESMDLFVVKEIQKFFEIENVVLKSRGGVNETISDRVDVTLILGFDIAQTL